MRTKPSADRRLNRRYFGCSTETMKKLLILLMTAGSARAQNIFPDWPKIWSSYDTRPKDCHQAVIDASGRKILVGVETIGDPRTMSARQAITLLVNEHGFWSEPIAISATGVVYFPALAVDANGKVWIAWSQFENNVWTVMVRAWDHGKLR